MSGIIMNETNLVRHDIKNFKKTILAFFDSTVNTFPSQLALTDRSETYTYRSLYEAVISVATFFQENLGVKKGDRIAFILKNCKEYVIAYYAAVRIGGIAVPLNYRLTSYELEFQLLDCSPALLIIDEKFWNSVKPIIGKIETCKHHIIVGGKGDQFDSLLERETRNDPKIAIEENDPALIMYTSGTTGRPKGALMSHWNIAFNSQVMAFPPELRYLNFSPLFHVTGMNACLNTCVANAGECILMERYRTAAALELIGKEKIELITAVPTVLSMMIDWPEFDKYDVKSVKYVACGGAPVPEILIEETLKKFPNLTFLLMFGLTETTSRIIYMECKNIRKAGTIGLPLPGIETKIIDNTGQELPPNTPGELIVKGPNIIQKYWNRPEETTRSIKGGWLYTGDLATIDEDGYHYLMGRRKELIIRGGENVYPVEVENAICQHPKVFECAVIGIADHLYGEEVCAFVILKEGENLTPQELQDFCSQYLADYKIPKIIKFANELPRNTMGKVLKEELKKADVSSGPWLK